MKLTLGPRRAAQSLERVVVWLTLAEIDQLLWDGDLEKTLREGGPTIKIVVDDRPESARMRDLLRDDD